MNIAIERSGAIAIVQVDHPPVNALSREVRSGLIAAVQTLDADPSVQAVLLTCAGRTFIAGADVNEFGKPPQAPHLPEVIAAIEQAAKPWAAAIHGSALGGGLEVALACRFRVALANAQLGVPEVNLGLVPGAGGCVRLPRLVGARKAAEMVVKGSPIKAPAALDVGLVDAVFENDLQQNALTWLSAVVEQPLPAPVLQRSVAGAALSSEEWEQVAKALLPRDKRLQAPAMALECVKRACEAPVAEAQAFERETFLSLRGSAQARAFRHVFFAERGATRPPEIKGVDTKEIQLAGVVGGGTMGAGIAMALRDVGINVVLMERDAESLQRGLDRISTTYHSSVKRGRISAETAEARIAGVRGVTDYTGLAEVDLVIEAVFEDLQVKRDVFAQLSAVCRLDAILATNTSYLDPAAIAHGVVAPERFIGLHFFSPAQIMKLLEIVPTAQTSMQTLATSFALAAKLRKIPVRAGICDGFIGNRILRVLRAQAERVLLAGATPSQVDAAMRAYGMPMGPFEAQDLGGLDIAAFQRKAAKERGEEVFAPVAEQLCEMGRLGQKTNGGWYDYEPGERKAIESAVVADVIAKVSADVAKQAWTEQDIIDCLVLPMVNEAALILQEGIAQRSADVDLVEIHGYGFPRWRGGLLQDAVERGVSEVIERLRHFAAVGMTPEPCQKLLAVAETGTF